MYFRISSQDFLQSDRTTHWIPYHVFSFTRMGITPVADVNQYDTRNISVPFYLVEMVMSKKGNGERVNERKKRRAHLRVGLPVSR